MSEPGFVVGGKYANSAGEYEVLSLSDSSVRIRYERGMEMTLPTQGLWSQWEHFVAERTGRPAPSAKPATATRSSSTGTAKKTTTRTPKIAKATGEAGQYQIAGYLALGCELHASVTGRDYVALAQRYKILTGRGLATPHAGLEVHERPTQRLGAELSVTFPGDSVTVGLLAFGRGKVEPAAVSGHYTVTHTELVEQLLRLGFDLGPNADPGRIREQIPEKHQADFDSGVSLRRRVVAVS